MNRSWNFAKETIVTFGKLCLESTNTIRQLSIRGSLALKYCRQLLVMSTLLVLDNCRHGFTLRQGANLSLAPPKSLVLVTTAVCSSKTCKELYRGGRFRRVGVVDLVVLACVLRATTKKGRQLFCLAPPHIFLQNRPWDNFIRKQTIMKSRDVTDRPDTHAVPISNDHVEARNERACGNALFHNGRWRRTLERRRIVVRILDHRRHVRRVTYIRLVSVK